MLNIFACMMNDAFPALMDTARDAIVHVLSITLSVFRHLRGVDHLYLHF